MPSTTIFGDLGRLNRQYYGLSSTECEENGSPGDNSPGRRRENAPAFSHLNVQEREDRDATKMGYKLLAGDLAGEVFAVEFQQTVRALNHAEAVGNEAVLQLIAGYQVNQNVRVFG